MPLSDDSHENTIRAQLAEATRLRTPISTATPTPAAQTVNQLPILSNHARKTSSSSMLSSVAAGKPVTAGTAPARPPGLRRPESGSGADSVSQQHPPNHQAQQQQQMMQMYTPFLAQQQQAGQQMQQMLNNAGSGVSTGIGAPSTGAQPSTLAMAQQNQLQNGTQLNFMLPAQRPAPAC
jgi:hypothetical protein